MYVSLVCCIIKYQGIVLQRIVHPLAQLCPRYHGTRRVVRITQIYYIKRTATWYLRHEAVLRSGGHIGHVRPSALLLVCATASYHDIGVDIDRIDRVCHADMVIPVEQLLEVAGIALGTVVDEYLINVKTHSAREEIVLQYGLTQEVISLFRTVATESLCRSHLVSGTVHGLYHGRTERLRHIAYAE